MATILIVDDSKFSRHVAKKAVATTGHYIVEAENGEEALAAVQVHQPDFVLTDLLMPVVDGVEFLERLRGNGSEIPVVVISADIQESTRARCEELGISGFLNKPFNPDELLDHIEKNLLELNGVSS
jgi:two-component system chemotaxis response regulator CheY